MAKDIFVHNGKQRNAFAYITRSNRLRYSLINWKAPTQAIWCWNLVTFCPLINEIWSKSDLLRSWPRQVRLTCHNKLHHRFSDPQNIELAKSIILSALVQKLRSKMSFSIMLAKVMHSRTPLIQIAQDIFNVLKRPNPCYLVFKFGNIFTINNCNMAQSVISQRSWPWMGPGHS